MVPTLILLLLISSSSIMVSSSPLFFSSGNAGLDGALQGAALGGLGGFFLGELVVIMSPKQLLLQFFMTQTFLQETPLQAAEEGVLEDEDVLEDKRFSLDKL